MQVEFNQPSMPPFDDYIDTVGGAYKKGIITNASLVIELEMAIKEAFGAPHCIAVANCTSGLILSLKCAGVNGKVALPSHTFFATAHAVIWNGLEPVFVDIDSETWNVDVNELKRLCDEEEIDAAMPVHIFGNPCPIEELESLSRERGFKIIFDSAHSMGAKVGETSIGRFGTAGVFSLSPTKLVVAGEGGIVCTDNDELAQKLRIARDYGNSGDYDPEIIGLNARMSELHAALGIESFRMLEMNVGRRNAIADRYRENLSGLPGIVFQKILPGCRSSYKDITILVKDEEFRIDRDALSSFLRSEGIDTRKYYYPPVHRTKAYWERWGRQYDEQLPVTNYVSRNVISLPVWSHMDLEIVDHVCEKIEYAHAHAEELKHQK